MKQKKKSPLHNTGKTTLTSPGKTSPSIPTYEAVVSFNVSVFGVCVCVYSHLGGTPRYGALGLPPITPPTRTRLMPMYKGSRQRRSLARIW